ncbi:MAG: S26 family signal peptidase [Natronomonas sp.]
MSDSGDDGPDADRSDGERDDTLGRILRFLRSDRMLVVYARDIGVSVGIVVLIGVLLFAVSGLWPPMVAVESPSMEPNMERGDLVFIVDNSRFVPEEAPTYDSRSTGVVPADVAAETGRTKFGKHGDVIVYTPNGDERRTPIIHRSILWVEEGENWYDRADERYVDSASNCEELNACPAPYGGFVTKGDNNRAYDQVGTSQISKLVRPEWVVGTAEIRVPYLGHVRLWASGAIITPLAYPGQHPATVQAILDANPTNTTTNRAGDEHVSISPIGATV